MVYIREEVIYMYTYYKDFSVRLYPTKIQEEKFWKHIHTCRALWNIMLEQNILQYNFSNKHIRYYDMCKILTIMKMDDEFSWLKEVSTHSLQRVCKNLDESFEEFFSKKKSHPKFKSRKSINKSFPISADRSVTYFISKNMVHIPKCGKVKCRFDYRKEDLDLRSIALRKPQIKLTANGKWILSFSIEYESQVFDNRNYSLGIDMGILEAATYSYRDLEGKVHSETIKNLNKSDRRVLELDRKIIKAQKALSRKYRTAIRLGTIHSESKRYQKALSKFKKLCYHRANIIKDYYQKATSHIVYDIRPSYIITESLNIAAMHKMKRLNRPIHDASWSTFLAILQYKADRVCIPVCKVPQIFPSSQICSNCGSKHKISLKDRVYFCEDCGLVIDRDINASINLMNYTQSL